MSMMNNLQCLSPIGTIKEGGLTVSKSGLPCGVESGGGWTNTGDCLIIGNKEAKPCKAIYHYKNGPLACEDHAVIPVRVGYFQLYMQRERENYTYELRQIISIEKETGKFKYKVVEPGLKHYNMIQAAIEKCNIYHCRKAIYVTNPL